MSKDFSIYTDAIDADDSMKLHYSGAMSSDINYVFIGNVFAYPTLQSVPNNKVRLQFEGNPIGFIIESAAGL